MLVQLATAFAIGIGSTLAPCALPLYPGFLAYLLANSGQVRRARAGALLGLLVMLGVLSMMLLAGLVLSLLKVATGFANALILPLADLTLILLGVLLLANKNFFVRLSQVSLPLGRSPYLNAYAYGWLFGPLVLPCSAPFLVSLFALSFSTADFLASLALYAAFGLGLGLPLLLLSLLAAGRQASITRFFASRHLWVERGAGLLLVLVGLYDLAANWEFARLYLSLLF